MKYKYSRKTVLRNLNLFLSPLFSGQKKLEVIKHYLFAKAPTKQGKKVKEIETDDLVHGGLRTDIFLASKINEVIGVVNCSPKNK